MLVFRPADRNRLDRIGPEVSKSGTGGGLREGSGDVSNRHGSICLLQGLPVAV